LTLNIQITEQNYYLSIQREAVDVAGLKKILIVRNYYQEVDF